MTGRLDGRIALVVGAGASGAGLSIGRAVAVEFAREGAAVLAVDIDRRSAEETAHAAEGAGGRAIAFGADAADPAQMQAAVAACTAQFGGLDILHNNVGVMAFGDPVALSLEEWDRVMQVNGRSCFLACKHAVPVMRARGGGAIVNVSSIAAIRSTGAPYPAYAASKAAILGLTRSLAIEYAPDNIRVNCVVPGFVDSPMMRGGIAQRFGEEAVDRMVAERARKLPMGRLARPEDIARACVFLASDDAAYITGAALPVDGGASAAVLL